MNRVAGLGVPLLAAAALLLTLLRPAGGTPALSTAARGGASRAQITATLTAASTVTTPTLTAVHATLAATRTGTAAALLTATPGLTPSPSPTGTVAVTATATLTVSLTPTVLLTPAGTPAASATATVTPTQVATPTLPPSATATPSPTLDPSIDATPTPTRSPSATPSPTLGATPTPSAEPSATALVAATTPPPSTPSRTATPSRTPTVTATRVPTRTPSPSPEASSTGDATAAEPATPTATPSRTASSTATPIVSPTRGGTPSGTATRTATALATSEATGTLPPPAPLPGLTLPLAAYGRWLGLSNVQTGIQVQNLSPDPADIAVTFVDDDGAEVAGVDLLADPEGAPNVYGPAVLGPAGAAPSLLGVRASSDAALGAIVRTDWFDDGGAGIAGSPQGASDVVVPSFVRRRGGRSSMVAVANTGTRTARITATLTTGPDGAPVRTRVRLVVPSGHTRRLWADFEAGFQALGPFEGWLELTSDGAPLSVQAWEVGEDDAASPRPVAAFEGMPLSSAAETLVVPLFRSAQRGLRPRETLSTRIVVVNPGPNDVEVGIAYHGADHAAASPICRGGTFDQAPVVIPAGGRHVFKQAPGGGHDLPSNCFGTARVTTGGADERVVAMVYDATVVDAAGDDVLVSAFTALPVGAAAVRVALPLFRRNHVGLSTGIQVMNVGPDAVDVAIAFSVTDAQTGASTPIDGCTVCRVRVEPDASATWWPPAIAALADGTFGGAVVTADGSVVVLVNDYPTTDRAAKRTDPATYLGLPFP